MNLPDNADAFSSVIFHFDEDALSRPLADVICQTEGGEDVPLRPRLSGWSRPGQLEMLLIGRVRQGSLFIRGQALFDNVDDAKNDYLMNPLTEVVSQSQGDDARETDVVAEEHVPFAVAIPTWGFREGSSVDRLQSVTLIVFWQEQL